VNFWQLSGLLFFIYTVIVIIQERKEGGLCYGKKCRNWSDCRGGSVTNCDACCGESDGLNA